MPPAGRARRALALAAAALAAALAAAQEPDPAPDDDASPERWELELDVPRPVDPARPARLDAVDTVGCAGCHEEIAEEWAGSLHALAWVDPLYQESLREKRRPESCHGCHVPEPLHLRPPEVAARKPLPRGEDERWELGVACRTCHAGPDGTILGPFGAPTDAHRSVRSETFVGTGANALCLPCHRTTVGPVIGVGADFERAGLGERGLTCVGCHMQAVERPIAADGEEAYPTRPGRSHALQGPRDPAFLAQAFGVSARPDGDGTLVEVANRAGHRVPGLVDRRIELRFAALGPDGAVLAEEALELDHRANLPVEEALEVRLPVPAAAVRWGGLHHAPGLDEPTPLPERTVPVVRR